MSEQDWQKAKAHFDGTKAIYQEMENTPGVNTTLALLAVFAPIERRYEEGERSSELYEAMLSVE